MRVDIGSDIGLLDRREAALPRRLQHLVDGPAADQRWEPVLVGELIDLGKRIDGQVDLAVHPGAGVCPISGD